MKVLLFGASGMIGSGVLLECLQDGRIEKVVVVGRSSCGVTSPKLQEFIVQDVFDCSAIAENLKDCDACFFCLGVSPGGMDEKSYSRLTYELTVGVAEMLIVLNNQICFCYVSGAGTDNTEQGRVMWARVKGKTENRLLAMGFRSAYMFRPGYIQPVKGVRSRTNWYQAIYTILGPFYPLLKRLFPNVITNTELVGHAMINAAKKGYESQILEAADINRLPGSSA